MSAGRKDGRSYRTDEFLKELNLALAIIPSMHSNNEINTVFAFVVPFLTKSAYPLLRKILEDWKEKHVTELFNTANWRKVDCQFKIICASWKLHNRTVLLFRNHPPQNHLSWSDLLLRLVIVITKSAPAFFYFCWLKTIMNIFVWTKNFIIFLFCELQSVYHSYCSSVKLGHLTVNMIQTINWVN